MLLLKLLLGWNCCCCWNCCWVVVSELVEPIAAFVGCSLSQHEILSWFWIDAWTSNVCGNCCCRCGLNCCCWGTQIAAAVAEIQTAAVAEEQIAAVVAEERTVAAAVAAEEQIAVVAEAQTVFAELGGYFSKNLSWWIPLPVMCPAMLLRAELLLSALNSWGRWALWMGKAVEQKLLL